MILFYSDYCHHCKMLIDSVNRLDTNKTIKLYNIDQYARPAQVKSVPALLLLPARDLLYGKQVFDHLLLPGRGLLVASGGRAEASATSATTATTATMASMQGGQVGMGGMGEPMGFSSSKAHTSSCFASIDNAEALPLGCQPDAWAWMESTGNTGAANLNMPVASATKQGPSATPAGSSVFGVETRDLSSKALPDMDAIMARREQDLRVGG